MTGVKPWYRLEMLRSYAESFGAESRLKQGADQLDELQRELGGHPLATRVAAYGLKDRSAGEVLASIRGQASQIQIPTTEEGMRSVSLEAVIGDAVSHISLEHRQALGLVGLFRGRFHQEQLIRLVSTEGFPDDALMNRSAESLVKSLREAAQLGLMAIDSTLPEVWVIAPGAQGALERIWRQDLSLEQTLAVEKHFVRFWSEQALLNHVRLRLKQQADQSLKFMLVEGGNLRRALDLASEQEDWGEAFGLLKPLLEFLPRVGRVKDADDLRNHWLGRVSTVGKPLDDPSERKLADFWRFLVGNSANRAMDSGDFDRALELHKEIVRVLEATPQPRWVDQANLAIGYRNLAEVGLELGRLDAAEKWSRKSLGIDEKLENRPGQADSYLKLGNIEVKRGCLADAEEWYRLAKRLQVDLGNLPDQASSCHNLGLVEQGRGQLDKAQEWYRRSLEIAESIVDLEGQAASSFQLGVIDLQRGHLDKAEEKFRRVLKISAKLGLQEGEARCFHELGMIEFERGHLGKAEEWFRHSLSIAESMGSRSGQAKSCHQLAQVQLYRGRLDEAEQLYHRSLRIHQDFGDYLGQSRSYHDLAIIKKNRGEFDSAENLCWRSLEIKKWSGDHPGRVRGYFLLGEIGIDRGQISEAKKWYRRSLKMARELGDHRGKARCLLRLGMIEEQSGDLDLALEQYLASWNLYSPLDLKEGAVAIRSIRRLDRTVGREAFLNLWEKVTKSRELPECLLEDDEGSATEERSGS